MSGSMVTLRADRDIIRTGRNIAHLHPCASLSSRRRGYRQASTRHHRRPSQEVPMPAKPRSTTKKAASAAKAATTKAAAAPKAPTAKAAAKAPAAKTSAKSKSTASKARANSKAKDTAAVAAAVS